MNRSGDERGVTGVHEGPRRQPRGYIVVQMLATTCNPRLYENYGRVPKKNTESSCRNTVADLALETAAKQIATMSSTQVLASLASASGASVAEAEVTEYQPTLPPSGPTLKARREYDASREKGKRHTQICCYRGKHRGTGYVPTFLHSTMCDTPCLTMRTRLLLRSTPLLPGEIPGFRRSAKPYWT